MHRKPTDAQLKSAYLAAPKPVQDSLNDGVATDFVLDLQSKYPIHIDTLGSITSLVRDLLLGFCSPPDFHAEMTLLVGEENARKIIAEFNSNVLLKLRDAEREEQEHPHLAEKPGISNPEPTNIIENQIQPVIPTPTVSPAAYYPPPAQGSVMPAQVPPPAPAPVPVSPPPAPAPAIPAGEYYPQMRTMATDIEAVREHRIPEPISVAHTTPPIVPAAPPQVVTPPPTPPAPPPQIAPVRPMPPPPANLPGAPVVKSYSVDPYREPVE